MNLANVIVVDEEKELVAKNWPSQISAELVSVEGILGNIVCVKVKIVGVQGFVLIQKVGNRVGPGSVRCGFDRDAGPLIRDRDLSSGNRRARRVCYIPHH